MIKKYFYILKYMWAAMKHKYNYGTCLFLYDILNSRDDIDYHQGTSIINCHLSRIIDFYKERCNITIHPNHLQVRQLETVLTDHIGDDLGGRYMFLDRLRFIHRTLTAHPELYKTAP